MQRKYNLPIPVKKSLYKLGKDLNTARRRRHISMALMAERAGFSRVTLAKIEKGDPSVAMGAYAAVIFVLGLTDKLENLLDITKDLLGQELQEEHLPKRIRIPKKQSEAEDE